MKREHLYVTRKHPCVWIMTLCMVASAATLIFAAQGTISTRLGIWCGIVLPCVAAIAYILIAVFSGEEMLYRTTIPVWILGLCFAIQHGSVLGWVFSLVFCVGYTYVITGKLNKVWLLPLYLLGLGGCLYVKSVPDGLAILGMLLLYPAIRVHNLVLAE